MRLDADQEISSWQNRWVKEIRKAIHKGGLTESGHLVAEGMHLLEEAQRSGLEILHAFVTAQSAKTVEALLGAGPLRLVSPNIMQELSGLEHAAGVVALIAPPAPASSSILAGGVTLLLDGVQDPGNAGTLLRSAEAFAAAAVIGLKGTVDLFHPKVLRASVGSAFRVPVLRHVRWQDLEVPRGITIAGATPRGGVAPKELKLEAGLVIVVGNEGAGISAEMQLVATPVTVPTCGVESLNAAVAGSILLYEAWCQR